MLSFLFVHHYGACRKKRKFNRCGMKVIFKKMLKMIRFWFEFEIHPIQRRNFNSISFYIGLPYMGFPDGSDQHVCLCVCVCVCVCARAYMLMHGYVHMRERQRG